MGGLCDYGVTPVPIGLGFGTALGLGLRGPDLGLRLDNIDKQIPYNENKCCTIDDQFTFLSTGLYRSYFLFFQQ